MDELERIDGLSEDRELYAHTTLRDGTPAWIWPLLPTDREALVQEFDTLSPESRRRRFLGPVVHLSEGMLQHLVDDVDGVNHVAVVLFAEQGDDVVPAGIARILRYESQPGAADLAVTVKDDWHGRGVATALLDVLIEMRPAGVTHILTEVAADNPASLAMLRRLGPTTTYDTGFGVLDVEVDLDHTGISLTDPDEERLSPVLKDPRRKEFRTRDFICPWLRSSDRTEAAGDADQAPGSEADDGR